MEAYDPGAYPPVAVTADIVLLTIRGEALNVLMIERGIDPFAGHLALPGGFVSPSESVDQAALRELREETGMRLGNVQLEQLKVYSEPYRDPRMRVITVAFLGFVPDLPLPQAGTDAARASWLPAYKFVDGELAFDHALILQDALRATCEVLERTTHATAFCRGEFTISELRRVYEATWNVELDHRNFQRKVLSVDGFLIPTDRRTIQDGGRPAMLYTAGKATTLSPPFYRPGRWD